MIKFKVCISARFMYNEYREYNVYTINAESKTSALELAKKVISHWNKKDHSMNYEIFDLWQDR